MSRGQKSFMLHGGLVVLLFVLQFVLPEYHHGNLARIMVLSVYAMGFNVLFGYSGLLSLGHAMFFAAGMYGMGLAMIHGGVSAAPALFIGIVCALLLSVAAGFLALRTIGVAFMIVTLMFAQAAWLTILYFTQWTRGDEGLVIQQARRAIAGIDLSDATNRYFAALILFAIVLIATSRLIQAPFGRVLVAIRENEERTRMLGYDVFAHKLGAVVLSGTFSAAAGAAAPRKMKSRRRSGASSTTSLSTALCFVSPPPRSARSIIMALGGWPLMRGGICRRCLALWVASCWPRARAG